jgi:hypothetical protein
MPRFYFHLHDDLDAVDEEGVECVDRETAMARAEGRRGNWPQKRFGVASFIWTTASSWPMIEVR